MADFSVQPEWLCQQNAVSLKVELWKFFQTFRSSLYVYIALHNQFILAERGRVSPRSFGISSVQRNGALRQCYMDQLPYAQRDEDVEHESPDGIKSQRRDLLQLLLSRT